MFKQLKEACDNMSKFNNQSLILLLLSFIMAYFILVIYDNLVCDSAHNEPDELEKLFNKSNLFNRNDRNNNPFSQFLHTIK